MSGNKTLRTSNPPRDKTLRGMGLGRKDKTLRHMKGEGFLDVLKSIGNSIKEVATSQSTIDNIYKPLANKGIEKLGEKIRGSGMYDSILKAKLGTGRRKAHRGKGAPSLLTAQAGVGRKKKR